MRKTLQKLTLALFLVVLGNMSFAQDCNCLEQFNFAVTKIETNYAGFTTKITDNNRAAYQQNVKEFRHQAGRVTNSDTCLKLVRGWMSFFRDGHMVVRSLSTNTSQKPSVSMASQFYFKNVNPQTNLIRIPSFNHIYKKLIDSMIKANYAAITSTRYLLIDVRGNGGGSDISYEELLPFIYTNPIIGVASEKLSTPDNISKYEAIVADPNYPEGTKTYARKVIAAMKKSPGQFYADNNDTIVLNQSLPMPALVGVIVDKKCASTTEQFLLTCRQSKKTVLFGENSGGVLDFANMNFLDFPCKKWQLGYATSRSKRLPESPVDNIGISPDVSISAMDGDWVNFATNYIPQMPSYSVSASDFTDTSKVDLKFLANQIAGQSVGTYNTVRNVVWWTNKNFHWNYTDYQRRTVKQIICQLGGNCNEQAQVVRALLRELNVKTRRTSEINIQPESERRQKNAEDRVAEIGNRGSVFGFRHNDHVWIEFYDEQQKEWVPADATLGLIGLEKWLKSRIGFEPRVNHAVIASAEMLVPIAVFAWNPDGTLAEDRSNYYLIESFNKVYNNKLEKLASWPHWQQLVQFIEVKSREAFEGKENLHHQTGKIKELKEVYEAMREEYNRLSK